MGCSPIPDANGGGLLGGAGNLLGTSSHTKTVNPNWYDPLGPTAMNARGQPVFAPTGAIPLRKGIFDQLGNLSPMFQSNADQAATALRAGAANPGFAAAQQLAQREINGDYLNGSPALDNAMASMREASNAGAANTNARTRSQFAQNGMSFGTANQQAQQAGQAAADAQANQTEAGARLQNYQTERAIQQQAPAQLDQSISAPINYLSSIPNQYLAPLSQAGQLIAGLSSGGQIAQPDTMVRPGAGSELLGAIGQL